MGAAIILAALCEVRAVAQTSYKFINIADTSGPFSLFGDFDINATGTVVFAAWLDGGGKGLFTSGGGSITTIADPSGSFDALNSPSISDAGLVVFEGFHNGRYGIYAGNGGPVATIADTSGPFLTLRTPSSNSTGAVAFVGIPRGSFDEGIFVVSADGTTTVATAGSSGPFYKFGSPHINDAGTVVFEALLNGLPSKQGIYAGSGGPLTTIVERPAYGPLGTPRINDSGSVVWSLGSPGTFGEALYRNDGGPSLIVDNAGPFREFFGYPDINNSGDVVFYAALDDVTRDGIYSGADPIADKVIEVGDTLFGSRLLSLIQSPRLNDARDVVFNYFLANGLRGIAVARVVPEPSALPLLGAALAIVAVRYSGRTPRRTSG